MGVSPFYRGQSVTKWDANRTSCTMNLLSISSEKKKKIQGYFTTIRFSNEPSQVQCPSSLNTWFLTWFQKDKRSHYTLPCVMLITNVEKGTCLQKVNLTPIFTKHTVSFKLKNASSLPRSVLIIHMVFQKFF